MHLGSKNEIKQVAFAMAYGILGYGLECLPTLTDKQYSKIDNLLNQILRLIYGINSENYLSYTTLFNMDVGLVRAIFMIVREFCF